jgi:hypothetical protein
VGTGDAFLDKLLSHDPGLDEDGAVPDLKVMDADISMAAGEVNASTLLDFFNQLSSKSSGSLDSLPIKEEPLSEEDLRALQKDRQKKDNHNMSKSIYNNHNMSKSIYNNHNMSKSFNNNNTSKICSSATEQTTSNRDSWV